jgi:hypothetical protein
VGFKAINGIGFDLMWLPLLELLCFGPAVPIAVFPLIVVDCVH